MISPSLPFPRVPITAGLVLTPSAYPRFNPVPRSSRLWCAAPTPPASTRSFKGTPPENPCRHPPASFLGGPPGAPPRCLEEFLEEPTQPESAGAETAARDLWEDYRVPEVRHPITYETSEHRIVNSSPERQLIVFQRHCRRWLLTAATKRCDYLRRRLSARRWRLLTSSTADCAARAASRRPIQSTPEALGASVRRTRLRAAAARLYAMPPRASLRRPARRSQSCLSLAECSSCAPQRSALGGFFTEGWHSPPGVSLCSFSVPVRGGPGSLHTRTRCAPATTSRAKHRGRGGRIARGGGITIHR